MNSAQCTDGHVGYCMCGTQTQTSRVIHKVKGRSAVGLYTCYSANQIRGPELIVV